MKTPPDAYGQRHTLREGPFSCTGSTVSMLPPEMHYTPEQTDWMLKNKSLYYTGDLGKDISHLPIELRAL